MREFTVIDNHSVDLGLISGGKVLDAGARGFRFSRFFAGIGCHVVAMDPAPEEYVPDDLREMNIRFYKTALVGPSHPRQAYLRMTEDPEARHVVTARDRSSDPLVHCMSIEDVMRGFCEEWDLVKLNIEGGEFDVLASWPGPIAKQIVVSFHEHTPQARGDVAIAGVLQRLSPWYDVYNHVKEPRYGCSPNYWDTVLIRKGGL